MERQPITLAFSRIAFEQVCKNFEQGKWISWDFPDYTICLELDPKLEDDRVIHLHNGRRLETQSIMDYTFPDSCLPEDITRILNLSYQEAVRCFESGCNLACIALCGRSIETVLGSLYEKITGKHPSKENNKPEINAIINRCKREGYNFPTGLKEKMELIALHRNMAVHGNLTIPTEDEARSVIYSTRDVLKISAK